MKSAKKVSLTDSFDFFFGDEDEDEVRASYRASSEEEDVAMQERAIAQARLDEAREAQNE